MSYSSNDVRKYLDHSLEGWDQKAMSTNSGAYEYSLGGGLSERF